MRKVSYVLLTVFVFTLFYSCAVIFKGTKSEVSLDSYPQRAKVYVNGAYMGETPLKLYLKCNEIYTIKFIKEGFKPVVRRISNHVQAGWVILDIIGGLAPVVIDAATGAWYELDEKNVNAILEKQKP